jgi:membrane protease YdiL (CAAX protease family)
MTAYLAALVIWGINTNRTFRNVFIAEGERVSFYWQSITESWIATLVLGACALLAGFSLDADLGLGLRFFQFHTAPVFTVVTLIAGGAFLLVMILQIVSLATNDAARVQAWRQISDGAGRNVALKDVAANLLIPRSEREKDLFTLVSLSAGICEEFTFRGVLFVIVATLLPGLSPYLIPLVAGALFGIAHSYQGLKGVAKTGLVGIGFCYLYLACGSLVPGIILHFVVDLANRFIFPDGFPPLLNEQPARHSNMIRPR